MYVIICLTNQGVDLENEDGDKAKIDVHYTKGFLPLNAMHSIIIIYCTGVVHLDTVTV